MNSPDSHRRWQPALLLVIIAYGCNGTSGQVTDPIADVPVAQQRFITRQHYGWRWPFIVGVGTLACTDGAVLFRANGVTYGLNPLGRTRGFGNPDSIRGIAAGGPPTNPLRRLNQDVRMRVFQAAESCRQAQADPERTHCSAQVMGQFGLSPAELSQVEAEGRERRWPPLSAELMSVDAVLHDGAALCAGR
jgi:hypothetical protein